MDDPEAIEPRLALAESAAILSVLQNKTSLFTVTSKLKYNFSEVSLILYDILRAYTVIELGGMRRSGEERPSHSNQRPSRPQWALPPITLALSRWRPR